MDRDELIAEIKKQLQEELKSYARPLTDKISAEHKDQVVEIKNEITTLVKDHPLLSIGVMTFAGFILGRLLYKKGDE